MNWMLISPYFGRDFHSFNKNFLSIYHALSTMLGDLEMIKRETQPRFGGEISSKERHLGGSWPGKVGRVGGCDRKYFRERSNLVNKIRGR